MTFEDAKHIVAPFTPAYQMMEAYMPLEHVPYYDPHADWSLIPDHMRGGVERYVMHGISGGSFLTLLFSGASLTDVVGRADEENQACLVGWARFLYNCVPAACKGSPEAVHDWIVSGGIVGQSVAN